jgi:O-antigen/teichoic acid export membrane protein
LQIISPIIIAIGISNLIGLQVLYPLGKIKIVTISTLVGAIINFLLNLLLIPKFAQNGAAIATVSAEICVTLTQFIIAKRFIPFRFIDKQFIYCFVTTLIMMLICKFFVNVGYSDVINLVVVPLIGVVFYGLVTIVNRNDTTIEILQTVCNKIRKELN